jgi:hypothetical protein
MTASPGIEPEITVVRGERRASCRYATHAFHSLSRNEKSNLLFSFFNTFFEEFANQRGILFHNLTPILEKEFFWMFIREG